MVFIRDQIRMNDTKQLICKRHRERKRKTGRQRERVKESTSLKITIARVKNVVQEHFIGVYKETSWIYGN